LTERRPRELRWAAVLAWAVLVALLSVLPGRSLPGGGIPGIDKAAHFVFYAALALLAQRAARKPCLTCWAVVTVSCALFGATLELAQRFVPGRSMSISDALVNLAGAAAGSAAYFLWNRERTAT